MKQQEDALIKRMQANLSVIRKVGGWTTEQFGEEIGVTRQTVSNLEKGRTPLTKTQYLAIRAVLIHAIGANGNVGLAQVIRALVDQPLEDSSKETDDEELKPTANAMEDMTRLTEMFTSKSVYAILTEACKAIGGPLTRSTVPAIIYAFTNHSRQK